MSGAEFGVGAAGDPGTLTGGANGPGPDPVGSSEIASFEPPPFVRAIGAEQVGVLGCDDGEFHDMKWMACIHCEPVYRLLFDPPQSGASPKGTLGEQLAATAKRGAATVARWEAEQSGASQSFGSDSVTTDRRENDE